MGIFLTLIYYLQDRITKRKTRMTTTRDLMREAVNYYPINQVSLHPDNSLFNKNQKSMLDIFKENLINASIPWYELSSINEVKPLIRENIPDADTICSTAQDVRTNKNLGHIINPFELKNMDVIIIRAEFGVAQTGMVWVAEKDMPIRSLRQIDQHLVILLHPDRMVKNMTEAYEEVYYNDDNYGSFLLGSSDIFSDRQTKETSGPLSISVFFV